MAAEEAPRPNRSYGRRKTKRLQGRRKECLDTRLPDYLVPAGEEPIVPDALFGASVPSLWLEIGFGGGEHLAALAHAHPQVHFIGCEPFLDGVAKLLARITEAGLSNIRICPEDVRPLLERLPEASLERVYILFPDPWPKQRHHKRRLINAALLAQLCRVLRPGGRLTVATDHAGYGEWILQHLLNEPRLYWTADAPEDFTQPPEGWVVTRYQEKAAAEGRLPVFLICTKR